MDRTTTLEIAELMHDVWDIPPAKRAAWLLRQRGFSSVQLQEFSLRTPAGRCLDAVWTNNTINELQDMERA